MSLPDKRVLIATGMDCSERVLASTELYDPSNDVWNAGAPILTPRTAVSIHRLIDGRVLLAGGVTFPSANTRVSTGSTEIYDPKTGSWSAGPPLNAPRSDHAGLILPDGRAIVVGGESVQTGQTTRLQQSAEVLDAAATGWKLLPLPGLAAAGAMALALPNGKVLVAGGSLSPGARSTGAFILDPDAGTTVTIPDMPVARSAGVATLLADGRALFTGGSPSIPATPWDLFDTVSFKWSSGTFTGSEQGHSLVTLADGRAVMFGGTQLYDSGPADSARVFVFDPHSNDWSASAPVLHARSAFTATPLEDGAVLIVGGNTVGSCADSDGAEIYTP